MRSPTAPLQLAVVPYGSPAYQATLVLRDRLLRRPLGLTFGHDELAAEASQLHLTASLDGVLVACLVLVPLGDDVMRMRQVAVEDAHQRRGIGTQLVRYSERVARQHGARLMTLHARLTAVPFYEKLGYDKEGDLFIEVSIPHLTMTRRLSDERPAE